MNLIFNLVVGGCIVALVAVSFIFGAYLFTGSNIVGVGTINNEQVAALQERVGALEVKLGSVSGEARDLKEELARREVVKQKSQDELLTEAAAAVSPSVVSLVVSKDLPKLEVVYENPFGDDPHFRDFNIRVPRFVEKGVERQTIGAGTGFFVKADGLIVTNRHVIEDEQAFFTALLSDGSKVPARVVYRDNTEDIAFLMITGRVVQPVAFGDSSSLKLGQTVFAVGNALGEFSNTISVGVISGLNRTLSVGNGSGQEQLSGVIQTDAAINLGNSGGPLVDLMGHVVGINVAKISGGDNIGFSIPVSRLISLMQREL